MGLRSSPTSPPPFRWETWTMLTWARTPTAPARSGRHRRSRRGGAGAVPRPEWLPRPLWLTELKRYQVRSRRTRDGRSFWTHPTCFMHGSACSGHECRTCNSPMPLLSVTCKTGEFGAITIRTPIRSFAGEKCSTSKTCFEDHSRGPLNPCWQL